MARNWAPLSARTAAYTRVWLVAPAIGVLFFVHWKLHGPLAPTVKVAVPPSTAMVEAGLAVMLQDAIVVPAGTIWMPAMPMPSFTCGSTICFVAVMVIVVSPAGATPPNRA